MSEQQTPHGLATWLASMDEPDSQARRTVTFQRIIDQAKQALDTPQPERCPTCKGSKWICPECGRAKPDCEASDCGVAAVSADGCPEGCAQPERYTVEEVGERLTSHDAIRAAGARLPGSEHDSAEDWAQETIEAAFSAAFPRHPQPAPEGEDGDWPEVVLARDGDGALEVATAEGDDPPRDPLPSYRQGGFDLCRYIPAPDSGEGS